MKMAKTFNSSTRNDLDQFLNSLDLEVRPSIHVNGREHPTAIVVVDFGSPKHPVRLNSEQNQELTGKLRKLTKDLLNKDVYIRVGSDNYNGVIYWTSVA